MSKSNGTTAVQTLDILANGAAELVLKTPEQIAKAAKRAARKAKQLNRTIEGNLSTNVVRVYVGETQALTMSFEDNAQLQAFIWMQLTDVTGPAIVKITK